MIWDLIATHNNFIFECDSLEGLWMLDASIPLKDKLLVELLRGTILWTIWFERNRVIFNDSQPMPIKAIGFKIISLATFWCKSRSDKSFFKLNLILPSDVKDLPDPILEEEEVITLMLSIAREEEEQIQTSRTGSLPDQMFGEELIDDDLLDY